MSVFPCFEAMCDVFAVGMISLANQIIEDDLDMETGRGIFRPIRGNYSKWIAIDSGAHVVGLKAL